MAKENRSWTRQGETFWRAHHEAWKRSWYYLSTVLDDFSRYIVAWKALPTMCASDVTATLDLALATSGLDSRHLGCRSGLARSGPRARSRWSASRHTP